MRPMTAGVTHDSTLGLPLHTKNRFSNFLHLFLQEAVMTGLTVLLSGPLERYFFL